ncbi:MAG: hypothetical protein AAB649_04975 [Patescibacteria group bacterium]
MVDSAIQFCDYYLIQGAVFWTDEGTHFAGVIERSLGCTIGGYSGKIRDRVGEAVLDTIELDYDRFLFRLKHEGCDDGFVFDFALQANNIWLGTCSSKKTKQVPCRCILTPVTEEFFQMPGASE